jgi:hypothetical protein
LDLVEIEAIRQLKYRYLRSLDTNRIDDLAECLAGDAVASYRDGEWVIEGRDAILQFLRSTHRISLHTAHHPEIVLTSETSATGIWALEDTHFFLEEGTLMHLAGHYHDTYIKDDGRWLIRSTAYSRLFHYQAAIAGELVWRPRSEGPGARNELDV